jgi:hypothetical protein
MLLVVLVLLHFAIKGTKVMWKKQDEQRAKNNEAIKKWFKNHVIVTIEGEPMYHEADVKRLIKILKPGLEID